jgi:Ulp1 family protease
MIKQIDYAYHGGAASEQFKEYDNQVVTRADLRRLEGLEWLNDEVGGGW